MDPKDAASRRDLAATKEGFSAAAAAFSQLTGVLGGFSITILVLALDSKAFENHRVAQNCVVALFLLAAFAYIYASGLLANSINVAGAASRFAAMNRTPKGGIVAHQKRVFSTGIYIFHTSNLALAAGLCITVLQYSLIIGFMATVVVAVLTIQVALINFRWIFRRRVRKR